MPVEQVRVVHGKLGVLFDVSRCEDDGELGMLSKEHHLVSDVFETGDVAIAAVISLHQQINPGLNRVSPDRENIQIGQRSTHIWERRRNEIRPILPP
ncbi:hypothetical protein MAP00_006202 [Monascus purpureus]|nr:hypothetical protein MAP00_006202 [Monascus purpureus]